MTRRATFWSCIPERDVSAREADADLLLIREDMTLDTVLARGTVMMEGGRLLVRGTYESAD